MIAIIGATGYIGRYLCPYLKNNGFDILALGRSKKISQFFDDRKIPFCFFDVNDSSSFDNLKKYSISAIVDLSACLAEHETPVEEFFNVNTLGAYKLLEFCRQQSIERFIMTSSHKVYNDVNVPIITEDEKISFKGDHSPYIISKIAAELFSEYYYKDFGISSIILRLTGVRGYGEILGHLYKDGSYKKSTLEIFFERALNGETIEVWGDQNIKRDHIYIKDVINAIRCSLTAQNDAHGIFNIASGKGYSLYEEALAIANVFAGKNGVSKIECNAEKKGLTHSYIYSISKAENILHWKPIFSDLTDMYIDYKKEWISKEYHNYHHFADGQAPKTL